MKRKRQEDEGMGQIKIWILGIFGTLVTGLAFGGWAVRDYISRELASKDEVVVVQVQVQSLYDARIEQLTIQRDRIARKPKKTEKDLQDLNDIDKELDLARKMRAGAIK